MKINQNNKDETIHGTLEFPLSIYDDYVHENILHFTSWHWHDSLQFCIVKKGTVIFQVNQDQIILHEGDGLFINAGALHKTENYQNTESYYVCYDIHPNLILSYSGSMINTKYILPYIKNQNIDYYILTKNEIWRNEIIIYLDEIYLLYHKKQNELDIHILFLKIWSLLYEHCLKTLDYKQCSIIDERMKVIFNYVELHYHEKIKLENISSIVGLTHSAVCREFHKYMNCTLFEYITNYRLLKSIDLLSTQLSITEIAYQCGFSTTSYYIDKFKKKTSMTPNHYRHQL